MKGQTLTFAPEGIETCSLSETAEEILLDLLWLPGVKNAPPPPTPS